MRFRQSWLRWPFQYTIKDIRRQWRYFWQRRFRGFDDSELWSLDYTFAKFAAPRMRAFIDTLGVRSVPVGLHIATEGTDAEREEWRSILEKIYRAFALIVKDNEEVLTDQENEDVENGLDLFRKWYHYLWD